MGVGYIKENYTVWKHLLNYFCQLLTIEFSSKYEILYFYCCISVTILDLVTVRGLDVPYNYNEKKLQVFYFMFLY